MRWLDSKSIRSLVTPWALVASGLGGAAQASSAWLTVDEARVLDAEACQAAASYQLWRAKLPPQGGRRATQRTRITELGLACGVGSGWQLGLEAFGADWDQSGTTRGLRLDARYALSQSQRHALSLGMRAQAERLSDSPVRHGTRYRGTEFSLRGEWRLGASQRLLGEVSRELLRGGERGAWNWSLGYGLQLGPSWEAVAEASGARHLKPAYGLGLRWAPADSALDYSLMLTRPREDQGLRQTGLKARVGLKF